MATLGAIDKAIRLAVLFFLALPRHTIIMTDKGFNRFDECAARCIHLFHRKKSAPLLPERAVAA